MTATGTSGKAAGSAALSRGLLMVCVAKVGQGARGRYAACGGDAGEVASTGAAGPVPPDAGERLVSLAAGYLFTPLSKPPESGGSRSEVSVVSAGACQSPSWRQHWAHAG